MSEPRMLNLGYGPPTSGPPVEVHPVMVISTAQANQGAEKAPSNGTYELNGGRFFVRAGDPIPEGATFTPKGTLAGGQEVAEEEPAEEPADGDGKKKARTRGPSETTEGSGPSETA